MGKIIGLMVLTGLMMILVACGQGEVQPAAINEETDTCAICNMAVANSQYTTQIVLENGKVIVFDDLGCMYEWLNNNQDQQIAAKFVRDYNDKEWLSVDDANYVYNQSIKTPMAYNIISFKDKASADAFVTENEGSTLMTSTDLSNHGWEQNHDMMKEHHIEDHSHGAETEDSHGHEEDTENHHGEGAEGTDNSSH